MKIIFKIFIITILIVNFNCEKTVNSSKNKEKIIKLDKIWEESKKSYDDASKVNLDDYSSIIQLAKTKMDTIIDNNLTVKNNNITEYLLLIKYKMIKPYENLTKHLADLKYLYNYNKSQYDLFRINLINEQIPTDSISIYFNQEVQGYNELLQKSNNIISITDTILYLKDTLNIQLKK